MFYGIIGLGVLLLILGFFFSHTLWVIGIVLIVIGVVLYLLGRGRTAV